MKIDIVYNKSCQRMNELLDESVDCTTTSPPYWGLRDYGDDVAEIWGGDPACDHRWDFQQVKHDNLRFRGKNSDVRNEQKLGVHSGSNTKSDFCVKCGAWHGQLGLEPTFQLYLDHVVAVCVEIKRVLKGTGSFWLNMGDTYLTGKGSCKNPGGGSKSWKSWNDKKAVFPRGRSAPNRMSKELPPKCLASIPWRLALRLIDEQGWILRNAIIWNKPNAMPSSVKDRCSNGYEFLFHLVKEKKYYYDLDAIREAHAPKSFTAVGCKYKPQKGTDNLGKIKGYNFAESMDVHTLNPAGKNPGDVWTIPTQPRPEAHFATFPDKLCVKPILSTCPQEICKKCGKARVRISKVKSNYTKRESAYQPNNEPTKVDSTGWKPPNSKTIGWTDCGCNAGFEPGIVLDPFAGRGTTLIMAKKLGRHYVGYELKKKYYKKLIEPTLAEIDPLFRDNKGNDLA